MFDRDGGASFTGDPPAAANSDALPDRRELALVAVERTRMPMVVTDAQRPDHPIVLANGAFLELTGYTAEEVIGRNCRFLQGPDTAKEAVELVRRGLAADEHHVQVELINYRKDGSAFWNQLAISPVHDEAGKLLYHFGSQQDVTARRRAEELEAIERSLLMEVDHRAMNALALVQSIMRLSRADTVERYAASVGARVDALARAHRLLAQSGWAGADLGTLIAMETPANLRTRVWMEGPATVLPAQIVQPVTLALHELMTNAVAHGGLCSAHEAHGALAARWTCEGEQVALQWREERGGPLSAPVEPGVGLTIARGVIERQLGGRLQMDWDGDALDAQVTIPLARASAVS